MSKKKKKGGTVTGLCALSLISLPVSHLLYEGDIMFGYINHYK